MIDLRTLLTLALLGCNGGKTDPVDDDDGTDGGGEACTDCDGDGYDSLASGGDDCDDYYAAVYPGAEETWYDGVDQDCDGMSDFDADLDTHDSDAHGGGDCDDGDSFANPLALELCETLADEDCDGEIDETGCGWTTDHAAGLWHDATLGFLGEALATDCDLDGDGVLEVLATAPGNEAEGVAGVVLTAARGGELMPADGLRIEHDDPAAGFGTYVDCHGDLNRDGYMDLAVTAFDEGKGHLALGQTRVYTGPVTGILGADEYDFHWAGEEGAGENIGKVVRVADVTGDDATDLLHGHGDSFSPWAGDDTAVIESGIVFVLRNPVIDGEFQGWDSDYVYIDGQGHGELDIADLDGDGVNDVLRPEFVDEPGVPRRCGAVYSGADVAAASTETRMDATNDAMAVLGCADFAKGSSGTGAWNIASDADLDGDGYPDPFVSLTDGFAAFRGGADRWSGLVQSEAKLEADFCGRRGVREADFTRASNGDLVWAIAMHGAPDCEARESNFTGRVTLFRGWDWATYTFDDAWTWVANDQDENGPDPSYLSSRPVRFSHDVETRLWWGDPAWTTDSARYGRLHAWDLSTFERTP